MHRKATLCIPILFASLGCHAFGGVRLTEVATATGKPSNVATLVTVTNGDEPVVGLRPNAFRLSEDGLALDPSTTDLRLLEPASVVEFYTVLLVDLSHAMTADGKQQLNQAVAGFVRYLRPRQSVTVIGFDGAAKPKILGEFPRDTRGTSSPSVDNLVPTPTDRSRNTRGGVATALDVLDSRLKRSGRALRFGTVVVFTRGPDVAGRMSSTDFDERLDKAQYRLVHVGVAADPKDGEVRRLAKHGDVEARDFGELSGAFEQAAMRVAQLSDQYYLVSYCSPGRGSPRLLRVEVDVVNDDLETETSSFDTRIDASKFSAGCTATKPPRFAAAK